MGPCSCTVRRTDSRRKGAQERGILDPKEPNSRPENSITAVEALTKQKVGEKVGLRQLFGRLVRRQGRGIEAGENIFVSSTITRKANPRGIVKALRL